MQVEAGSVIANRFEIVKRIGAGGMGMVFKAVDRELNNDVVALKLLLPHLASDEQVFKRFLNEVLVARSLSHPNIVRIHDIGKAEGGYYYISMEFVDGFSLKERIGSNRDPSAESPTELSFSPLTFEESVQILADVASGVSYAHSKGVIHRDLKPGNVLISKRGEVKLADFGTARIAGGDTSLTQTGQVIGTPDYMSPEQIRGEQLDSSCDIYSLGILAYELVTGERPFVADSAVAVAFKHLGEPLPPFPERLKNIPAWYRALLEKATAKDKSQRFKNGLEFFSELQKHLPSILQGTRFFGVPQAALTETGKFEMGDSRESGSGTEWRFTDENSGTKSIPTAVPKRKGGWGLPLLLLLLVIGGGVAFFEFRDELLPVREEKKTVAKTLSADEIADQLLQVAPTPKIEPTAPTVTTLPAVSPSEEPTPESVPPTPEPTPQPTPEPVPTVATPAPTEVPTPEPTPLPTKQIPHSAEVRLKYSGSDVSMLNAEELNEASWSVMVKGIKAGDADSLSLNLVNAERGAIVSKLRKGSVSSQGDGVRLEGQFEGPARRLTGGTYRIDLIYDRELLASKKFRVEEPIDAITPEPTVAPTAEVLEPRQEIAESRRYTGTIELLGEDGLSSRSLTMNLTFTGVEITGTASVQGFGELSVSGRELERGYEISLRGETLQLRLTSGKSPTGLRGSYLVAGKPIRGAWQAKRIE